MSRVVAIHRAVVRIRLRTSSGRTIPYRPVAWSRLGAFDLHRLGVRVVSEQRGKV